MLPAIIGALGGGGGLSSMAGLAGQGSNVGQAEANALQQGMKHAGPYVDSPMRVPQQQAPAQQAPQQQGTMQAPPFYLASPETQQQVIGQWMNTQPQSLQQQWGMRNGF